MLIFFKKDQIIHRLFYILLIFLLFYLIFLPNIFEINLLIMSSFYILFIWKFITVIEDYF
jgi:hypothetical protein